MIARLVLIHVILPDQLQGFCENGNLRVAVILFGLWRLRLLRENAGIAPNRTQANNGMITTRLMFCPISKNDMTIAHEEFLATPNAEFVCSDTRRMRTPFIISLTLGFSRVYNNGQQSTSRFNGFPANRKPLKRFHSAVLRFHRAKARC